MSVIVVINRAAQHMVHEAISVLETDIVPTEIGSEDFAKGMSLKEFYQKYGITPEMLFELFPPEDPTNYNFGVNKDFRAATRFPVGGEEVQKIANHIKRPIVVFYSAEKGDPIEKIREYYP